MYIEDAILTYDCIYISTSAWMGMYKGKKEWVIVPAADTKYLCKDPLVSNNYFADILNEYQDCKTNNLSSSRNDSTNQDSCKQPCPSAKYARKYRYFITFCKQSCPSAKSLFKCYKIYVYIYIYIHTLILNRATLEEGEYIYIPQDVGHAVRNIGEVNIAVAFNFVEPATPKVSKTVNHIRVVYHI